MTTRKQTKTRVKAGTSKASAADKKALFVEAYLSNGGNATEAALAAGYSKGGASKAGYRMTKDVQVMSLLDSRRIAVIAKAELSTEKSLRETARIAYSDPRKIMNAEGKILMPHELDEETAAAIASFEITFDGGIKYKFWPKTTALDQAHKIQGHYEKDNRQKTDPLRDLLSELSGNVLGVSKHFNESED